MARTLLDADREALLDERGWVVVPLLDASEVAELCEFYRSRAAAGLNPDGAYNSTYAEFSVIHSAPGFRAEAFDKIVDVVAARAEPLLDSFRPLVANFVNKLPGRGVVPMHQNWSVVDESRFRSVSVWVALVDCDGGNGAMELLPGSHRRFREPRGMWAYEMFDDIEGDVRDLLERVDVRAGDAIILDDAVVHFSPPNDSAADRLAIQLIMVPNDATPLFYQRVGGDGDEMLVDVWAVEERFFWDFWHGEGDRRHGAVVDRVRLPKARLDLAEFSARYRRAR
jgi:hypothetical protein